MPRLCNHAPHRTGTPRVHADRVPERPNPRIWCQWRERRSLAGYPDRPPALVPSWSVCLPRKRAGPDRSGRVADVAPETDSRPSGAGRGGHQSEVTEWASDVRSGVRPTIKASNRPNEDTAMETDSLTPDGSEKPENPAGPVAAAPAGSQEMFPGEARGDYTGCPRCNEPVLRLWRSHASLPTLYRLVCFRCSWAGPTFEVRQHLDDSENAEVSDAARHGVELPNSERGGVREHWLVSHERLIRLENPRYRKCSQ